MKLNPFDTLDLAESESTPDLTREPVANPFDALDDEHQPVLMAAERPGFAERVAINFEAAQRTGTLSGALTDAADKRLPPQERVNAESREKFDARYESFPQWDTPLEGLAALGGQVVGGLAAPENFVPVGLGAALLERAGASVTSLGARIFAGATDGAVANVVTDAGIQGLEVATDRRESFSPLQLGASAAIGAVAGGGLGAAIGRRAGDASVAEEVIGDRYVRQAQERGFATAPEAKAPEASTPELEPGSEPLEEIVVDTSETTPAAAPAPDTVTKFDSANAKPDAGGAAGVHLFDPAELKVDAKRFQFKDGGDADGVTSTLKGVTSWRPERGNQLIVWQSKEGELFVVDGHQRTGLARRLVAEGKESSIEIPGVLFREADGISDADAMTIAAMKNIAEGSASPVDAAKILKAAGPEALQDLPISKDAVRTAVDLARLGDEPWRMVTNGVVEANHAKYVGRYLPEDPARQLAAMKVLAKAGPSNEAEAALLVRRVGDAELAKADAGSQTDMFGDAPESTALEEVKIAAAAMKALKSDTRLYSRLIKDADRIEAVGTTVERDRAAGAASEAEQLAFNVEKLAFREGAVRDTLVTVARDLKNGRVSLGQARDAFVNAIRRAETDASGGRPEGGAGRGEPEPDGAQPDDAGPGLFDDDGLLGSIAGASGAKKPDADLRGVFGTPAEGLSAAQSLQLKKPRGAPARAVAGVAANPNDTPAAIRLREVGNALIDAIDPAAARQGRFSIKGKGGVVMGQYSPRSGVVRIRNVDDFDTLTHELGHHLETVLGKPLQPVLKLFAPELEPLAYAGADPAQLMREGFAEYVRLMATNPAYSARQAPAFDQAFRALIAKERPDLLTAIEDAQSAYRAWLDQPSQQAVASTIIAAKRPSWWEKTGEQLKELGIRGTLADWLGRAYVAGVDELAPMQRAVRDLARIAATNTGAKLDLKVGDDAYKLLRLARAASSSGHMDVLYGVHGYRSYGGPVSASLRDALVEATGVTSALGKLDEGKLQSFGAYLWSRRAIGEWDRFEAGVIPNPPDKLSLGDHTTNIRELEAANPAFVDAADKVYDWNRALWSKKLEAGLITREQFDAGLEVVDYVPGLRVFDPEAGDGAAAGGRGGQDARSDQVKRFKGSTRDVVNPIDSMIADAYETAVAIARNDAIRALDRLAKMAGPGGGRIAERIPSHELRAMQIDPIEAFNSAAKAAGLSPLDHIAIRDAMEAGLGDAKAAIFRPAVTGPRGEPIVFFREGGEVRALRLADGELGRDLMTLMNAPVGQAQKDLFAGVLARGAGILRAGVTTSPDFILANFFRDQVTSIVYYGGPFKRVKATLSGTADELFGREAARQYNAAGGIMGGVETSALRDTMVERDLQKLSRKGFVARRFTSLKGFLEATEISETGTRIGLFKTFFEEAQKRGLAKDEAMLEAAWRARDHIDFDRRGSRMTVVNRVTPFLNASLQGLDKSWRQLVEPLVREGVTVEDARARAMAAGAWARLSALVVGGMTLHAVMSQDEDYRELSPQTRATHWAIKMGDKWAVIPKPFEAVQLLGLAESAWDAIALKDPRWADQFLWSLHAGAPPSPFMDNPLVKTFFEVKTGVSTFTDGPIVPDTLKALEPQLQFTARTSAAAKALGQAFGTSPLVIDHMVFSMTGSWGRSVMAMSDWASGEKPAQGWDDAPITRRFIKDASRGSKSSTEFWKLIGTQTGALEGKANSYKELMGADPESADKLLNGLKDRERAFVTVSMLKADVKRAHPLLRARGAVQAIGALRREIGFDRAAGADGDVKLTRAQRGQADDILADLAMAEARNALVDAGVPGWAGRQIIPTDTFVRELTAVSPELVGVLADRYATKKVLKADAVRTFWPELQGRLLKDGTEALTGDLVAAAASQGFELETGRRIKPRPKPQVRGRGDGD